MVEFRRFWRYSKQIGVNAFQSLYGSTIFLRKKCSMIRTSCPHLIFSPLVGWSIISVKARPSTRRCVRLFWISQKTLSLCEWCNPFLVYGYKKLARWVAIFRKNRLVQIREEYSFVNFSIFLIFFTILMGHSVLCLRFRNFSHNVCFYVFHPCGCHFPQKIAHCLQLNV